MKINSKILITVITVFLVLFGAVCAYALGGNEFSDIGILSAGDYFYDVQFYNGQLPNGYTINVSAISPMSPIRSGGSSVYSNVSSKMAEIRSISPNPHNGVDLLYLV